MILYGLGFIIFNEHISPQYYYVWRVFFLYLYDLDRTIAFIKHSDSAEINCADVRMDPEQTNDRSLGTTIILGT